MRVSWGVVWLFIFSLAGCPRPVPPSVPELVPPPQEEEDARPLVLDRVGGTTLLHLYVDGFSELSLQEKMLAYHLVRAAVAGRDIAYDQQHRFALELRWILNQILSYSGGISDQVLDPIRQYARMFWLNNGPYHGRTRAKTVPGFSRSQWIMSVGTAQANGGDFKRFGRDLGPVLARLDKLLFDPSFEPWLTRKGGDEEDVLITSFTNYYQDVRGSDLAGFAESFPLNSRLVKECDRRKRCSLKEEVYRTGTTQGKRRIPPGRYARELGEVIAHLQRAREYALPDQATRIDLLVEYFRTGDPTAFERADIAWLGTDSTVDFILGFIETYKDVRGRKGEYEGIVYIKDKKASALMEGIAGEAAYFEARAPWDSRYRKPDPKVTVASAIQVLVGIGGGGPSMPGGINLPNAQWIREKHGSRSVLSMNVLSAARRATSMASLEEFCWPGDLQLVRRWRPGISNAMVALHEVIGHGSGQVSPELKGDPSEHLKETYSALEEARAELMALYFIGDPRLQEIGITWNADKAREVAFREYLRHAMVMLRRVPNGDRLEDDHMRASHLIVQYVLHNEGGAVHETLDGKSYYRLMDVSAMHRKVGELLAEVMRIKAEGDLAAGRALLAQYGTRIDTSLRDEVVSRAKAAGVPDFVAFHSPSLHTVVQDGNVVDVVLNYDRSFDQTMLEWDLLGP
jgi:dipeptidyl-peptidase-3